MTTFQKVIKYCAMGFAILLTVGIISTILNVGLGIVGAFSNADKNETYNTVDDFTNKIESINSIVVDISAGAVEFTEGTKFTVEATEVGGYSCTLDGDTIKVDASASGFFNNFSSGNTKIKITLPKEMELDYTKVDLGAGKVDVSYLVSKEVRLDIGVGEICGDNIDIKDANIDLGIGSVKLSGLISGNSIMDNGIGDIKVNLYNASNDYYIKDSAGIGDSKITGNKNSVSDSEANNSLKLECGIGSIKAIFNEE